MIAPFVLSLLLAAAGPADVAWASPRQSDPAAASRVLVSAAMQIKRCYRSPPIAREARQITTRLRVRYAQDGTLAQMPLVVTQDGITPENQPFAARMAEAAIQAVIRCAPLRLPADEYDRIWREFELTFSPSGVA